MSSFDELISRSNLFLAPIAGFTDSPFRRIARRHGAGPVLTELISSDGLVRNSRKTYDLARFHEEERPLGIQIFGNSPAIMGEAAAAVNDLGPDFIDINMGCPATRVCKGGEGSGAALLKDPLLAGAIAAEVVRRAAVPVSAKIRLGWDAKTRNYAEVVKALADGGISFIIVHGRTGSQKYSGAADWDAIGEIRDLSPVPVVGNGDIISHDDARDKLRESRCPAVMIGRGALGNPWIFSGRVPPVREIIDQVKEHLAMMLEYYGDKGLILMRKHLVRYIHGMRNASSLRRDLVTASDTATIHELLERLSG